MTDTHTEMVERLAEAIADAGKTSQSRSWKEWVHTAENHAEPDEREFAQEWIEQRRKEARAAIEAMSSPTPAMLQAAHGWREFDTPEWVESSSWDHTHYGVWRAMISDALTTTDSKGGE